MVSTDLTLDSARTDAPDEVMSFAFGGHILRAVMVNGEPWFVLADVCRAVAIANPRNVAGRLNEDDKGVRPMDTPGGRQNVGMINESGLYEVIIRSDKPEAAKFRRWITSEVLPAIRKTGSYTRYPAHAQATLPSKRELAQWVIEAEDRADRAEAKVAELEPKAEFYDELMEADGTYSFLAVSKMLSWGRTTLMAQLRRLGVLQSNNLPYRRYEHHFKVTPGTYVNRKTGETVPTATTTVRPSGIDFLRKKLSRAMESADSEQP